MFEIQGQTFEIEFTGKKHEMSVSDSKFLESIEDAAIMLFRKSVDYLMPILNPSKVEYSEDPFLNLIEIIPISEKSYKVRVEMYFQKEERLHWWVMFNVPYPFPPFIVGTERIYYPIELGRYVE